MKVLLIKCLKTEYFCLFVTVFGTTKRYIHESDYDRFAKNNQTRPSDEVIFSSKKPIENHEQFLKWSENGGLHKK